MNVNFSPAIDSATANGATAFQTAEQKAIAAERNARIDRINRDRLVASAIDTLLADATDKSVAADVAFYLIGAANLQTSHLSGEGNELRTYVAELIATIRRELSPLATGR